MKIKQYVFKYKITNSKINFTILQHFTIKKHT